MFQSEVSVIISMSSELFAVKLYVSWRLVLYNSVLYTA
jgi:hypothetical protein